MAVRRDDGCVSLTLGKVLPCGSRAANMALPSAVCLIRRMMLAGAVLLGTRLFVTPCAVGVAPRFVIVKMRRTVPPSSHPAWSARLKRTSRTPDGFHEDAELGEKDTALRAVM